MKDTHTQKCRPIQPTMKHNWSLEHAKLKARIELLQKTQRHFMGEDLDSLSLKELQNLEQQLDTALKHVRLRKDKELQDQNNTLSKQIKELEKDIPSHQQQNNETMPSFQFNIFNNP
uniref:K-box domain-containing protein n=1 Tax=Lactuca sativa TaxID=4236 RepID=A0A9R1XGQ5_LACSA|nr:hypothetical protein LSAT_V11C400201160 [Lactuca sativa]